MDKEEKRNFRRYRKPVEFNIPLKGEIFKAEVTDYSLSGIGAIIEDTPPVKKGDTIEVNISSPEIKTNGKVVWVKKINSGLRVGVKNIGSLSGKLSDYELADSIVGLQRTNKTGILEVKSGTIVKKVYIKNGDVIFATSNQDEDRLGDILLAKGKITRAQYDQSVEEMKKTGQRQGTALVRLGYLKPQELVWAVTHQVEEIIIGLFDMTEGNFVFNEGPLPTDEAITLKLSAANLIYRGVKRIRNLNNIKNSLPSMDAVLHFSHDPLKLFQDMGLDSDGKAVLSYIDGKSKINDIIAISSIDRFEAFKTIYALLKVGIIEILEEQKEDIAEVSAEDVVKEPEIDVPQDVINAIEEMYSKHESLGYYGVLGIKEWATPNEVRKAYYKVAKEFHPDRHFYLNSPDLKEKLHVIFSYVTQAYTTLSNPEKKAAYDRLLSQKPAPTLSNKELAIARFEEGKIELAKYNTAQAMELFGQATYLDSSVAKYHYYYSIALNSLGRVKEAGRAIERALKIEPSNVEYLTEAGHLYIKLGFYHRAKSTFEKALKFSPANQKAVEGLRVLSKESP